MRSLLALLLLACGTPPFMIEAREDARVDQDAGVENPDGGCVPPAPPAWVPFDTMGPAGEDLAACIARAGAMTDDRVPVDQSYDLTTFGSAGEPQPVACADMPVADGTWYYAADSQRFACGQYVRIVDAARTHCAIVRIADVGPSACVEEAGARPVFDVSPLAARALFDVDAVDYSEHRAVFAAQVATENALGACDAALADPRSYLRNFIGGPCDSPGDCGFTGGICLTAADGYPGGTCSMPCETTCPDLGGANAYTACVPMEDGMNRCLPRCDYTLFDHGCRDGYVCEERPHPAGGAPRRVCIPLACD